MEPTPAASAGRVKAHVAEEQPVDPGLLFPGEKVESSGRIFQQQAHGLVCLLAFNRAGLFLGDALLDLGEFNSVALHLV